MDKELQVAIEAVYTAASAIRKEAIRKMNGVVKVSVDGDHKGAELFFNVGTRSFKMALEEVAE